MIFTFNLEKLVNFNSLLYTSLAELQVMGYEEGIKYDYDFKNFFVEVTIATELLKFLPADLVEKLKKI